MARFIERAGNMARLVDVNSQFLLDAHLESSRQTKEYWLPVLESTVLTEAYENGDNTMDVTEFLALSNENPESIRSCISTARENARMVRDQISDEMWVELNTLHLFLTSPLAEQQWREAPVDFCNRIIRFSLLFQGLTDATIPHTEGWHFFQLGIFLERADKTSRMLDVPHRLTGINSAQPWATVLSSCSARSAFWELYGGEVTERYISDLLIFSDVFPRSIRFCLSRVDETLHKISGTPQGQYSNELERVSGATLGGLNFSSFDEVAAMGLPAYLDRLQQQFNDIGQLIFETYVLLPSEMKSITQDHRRAYVYQQQQSQQ